MRFYVVVIVIMHTRFATPSVASNMNPTILTVQGNLLRYDMNDLWHNFRHEYLPNTRDEVSNGNGDGSPANGRAYRRES